MLTSMSAEAFRIHHTIDTGGWKIAVLVSILCVNFKSQKTTTDVGTAFSVVKFMLQTSTNDVLHNFLTSYAHMHTFQWLHEVEKW